MVTVMCAALDALQGIVFDPKNDTVLLIDTYAPETGEICGHCATFEDFAMLKLDYVFERELGPGEIVRITADSVTQLAAPRKKKRVCAFLWTYYGYPNAVYEGINVEESGSRQKVR